jgi:class 3 adenylate cyclase
MHLITLPAETILMLRNRISSLTIPERMRDGLFRGFVFSLLLASAVPAVNALRDPQRYITYQDRLIDFFNKRAGQAGPVPSTRFQGPTGVRIDALTKLISCGFVLVLMRKAGHRRPVRAMILLVAFLSASADPPLAGLLERQSSADIMPALWAAELVHPFIVAALLRFAVLFPRPLTPTELLPHLSRAHPGMLRRGAARLALIGFLIRSGTATVSRVPSISWFDAAIVLALATFLFLTPLTDWAWSRNYQVAATAALIVVTRLVATAWKLWIRKGPREHSSRQSLAGPLLISMYALAVGTQPKWVSARPVELVILVVTIGCVAWMLRRKRRSYLLFSDLQLALTRPFPVWSAALIAYVVFVGSLVSLTSMNVSVGPAWLVGVVVVAAMIGSLVVFLITVGLLLLALKFLRIGYVLGDASDRKRVLWIVEGVAIVAALQAVSAAAWVILHGAIPPEVIEYGSRLVQSANLPVILLSFGVAVFYYGALDPGLIIRRTTLYTASFVLSVFVFEGVENLLSWIVSPLLETRELPVWLVSTIAAGTAALAFMLIRRLCAPLVARYLPVVFSGVIEADPTRRTAVILVTDLVGYTATTLDDERGASALVSLLRQVVKEVAGAGGGRVIECSRDLALVEFPDVASAVTACRRLFERFHKACDSRGLSHARLRASVHAGDLLFAADGVVTGRAVTIANRLRERASAGEILLSHTAMAGLPQVLRDAVENLGPTTLRDVPEPQECFRLRVL